MTLSAATVVGKTETGLRFQGQGEHEGAVGPFQQEFHQPWMVEGVQVGDDVGQ
ncbi:hypothetical protein HNR06_005316 [Nocardiopsis arvandica]|uniref:Uncharacterized protein n=1 Tax=Nocardiopsis sinuspersici TaxID=501010 RepID=A0A7Z0BNM1_9ACTN|nr:hypothetical protein [Nocardiopsis sinuspersici]NYH55727.1 hypothetical protein [Nocardiopsis sinuspersici]